jgi:MFS family permease
MLGQGWLVLEMTDSPFWVGLIAGMQGLGLVGFGPLGGTIVDRFDKRKVLAIVHFGGGITTCITGILIITGGIQLWHMPILALVQGMFMATQIPASNALAYQLVGPHRLLNAMATRLTAMNISRVIGSLIAGTLITTYGVGSSYLFAAMSSVVGMSILWFIKGTFKEPVNENPFWQNIRLGLRYVWVVTPIRKLLLLSLLMESFGFSHLVMMPVMARDVLGLGADGLGYLSAASGIGATLSTLTVASLGDFQHKGKLLVFTAIGTGLTLILFAFSPWFAISLIMVALVGALIMAYDVTMSTMLQITSASDMRGRVLGFYGLTFGFTPIGGFVAGSIATAFSASIAVGAGGVIIVLYVTRIARSFIRTN